ncbi:hypothetical protein WA577_003484 [Blastocystis sp. JDR]
MQAMFLSKDAKDIARKTLEIDPEADVEEQRQIVVDAARLEMIDAQKEELILHCLNQYQNSIDITGENMEDAIGRIVQERLGSTNTTSHRFVKDFNDMKRSMTARNRNNDDDIEIDGVEMDTKSRLLCPISRERFVHPVRNKGCKHTYSRDAIVNLIGHKTSVKCPVKGCNKNVSLNSLEDDEEMMWLLEQ